jgi:RNA polymerase sigma-70 factor (ECF subfamily)
MDLSGFKNSIISLNGRLYRYAFMLLKDSNEAQDAVQEVCLKLWKIKESLNNFQNLEAFAIKVTRNWCLDRIKARKPIYVESYNSLYDSNTVGSDPHQVLENADQLKLLFMIMDKLPVQQRDIIQFREIENLEFEEISEIMDMSINAIRVNLSRARNKIKEEMIKFESHEQSPNSTISRKIL